MLGRFSVSTAPTLSHPLLIGDFSIDTNRDFHHDKRNMCHVNIDWDPSVTKEVNS